MPNEGVLQVRMLGEFSMIWEGKEIWGGSKASDAQFTRLLQLLLHNRKGGIERTKLQSLLFDDSNSDDIHHLLRTVIYNARRKLAKSGLPDVQFIEFREGRYYWSGEIPVELDTESFENLCRDAEEEQSDDAKLKKYLAAISAYKGSFLPNQTRLTWAAAEESRYRDLFTKCVESAVRLLKERNDYSGIERLGRRASVVCPLNDWEYLILESYLQTGRIREAQDLYERTLDYYRNRLGAESVVDREDQVERFLNMSDMQYSGIKEIAKELQEEQKSECGYYCSYPVFRGIYRMLNRSMISRGISPYLMLCSVIKSRINGTRDVEAYEKRIEGAREAICSVTDDTMVICRCSRGQFLILIPDGKEDRCRGLENRIRSRFRKDGRSDDALSFKVLPLRK